MSQCRRQSVTFCVIHLMPMNLPSRAVGRADPQQIPTRAALQTVPQTLDPRIAPRENPSMSPQALGQVLDPLPAIRLGRGGRRGNKLLQRSGKGEAPHAAFFAPGPQRLRRLAARVSTHVVWWAEPSPLETSRLLIPRNSRSCNPVPGLRRH